MQNSLFIISIIFILLCLPAVSACAQITLGADIGNAYTPVDSPLSDTSVFQPYISFTTDMISIETWASYDSGDSFSEYEELNLEYAFISDTDFYSIKAGLIQYRFTDDSPSTSELFIDWFAGMKEGPYFRTAFYYDIDEFNDFYMMAGPGYYLPIGRSSGIRAEITGGLAGDSYSASARGGLYDLVTTLSYEYFFQEGLTASLTVKYIDSLDEKVYPVPDINMYILAGISYSF